VLPVSLPNTSYALSAYYIIASAEASSNLARYDGVQYGLHVPLPPDAVARSSGEVYAHSRTAGFGAEVKRRILLGTYALTAEYSPPPPFSDIPPSDRVLFAVRSTTTFCKPSAYASVFVTT
jgi:Asp-tRNA(Asn)/Glu-tRNA(Gln) amidotransferase A subunit family amidase